jgi:hypothetical protein
VGHGLAVSVLDLVGVGRPPFVSAVPDTARVIEAKPSVAVGT